MHTYRSPYFTALHEDVRCITSQKSEDIFHTSAKASNHTKIIILLRAFSKVFEMIKTRSGMKMNGFKYLLSIRF
jgi:hypothetical protein